MFICEKCNKSFKSKMALVGHSKAHKGYNDTIYKCCCVLTRKEMRPHYLERYQKQLKQCQKPGCNKWFKPKQNTTGLYCSHSCSATVNNKKRDSKTVEVRNKISKTLLLKHAIQNSDIKRIEDINNGIINRTNITLKQHKEQRSKTPKGYFTFKCKHCQIHFNTKRRKGYCDNCECLYMANNRNRFKFTFNVYKYPDLFDLKLLSQVGFFAPGGRSGKWNPNGLSRDHKISVNEAIKNNYNPYYIKHPLNCELMPQIQNAQKHTNSSLSYSELVILVNEYEKLAPT